MNEVDELAERLEQERAAGNGQAAAVVVDEHGPVYGEVHVHHEEPDRFLGGEIARMGLISWQVEAELPIARAWEIYNAAEACIVRFGPAIDRIDCFGNAHATSLTARENDPRPIVAVVTFMGNGPIARHAVNVA